MNKAEKPMSVMHVNDRLVIGGVATIILMLDRALFEINSQSIITIEDNEHSLRCNKNLLQISFGLSGLRKFITLIASIFPLKMLWKIAHEKKKGNKVILHLHSPYPTTAIASVIASIFTRTPLVYSVHANRTHLNCFYWRIENLIIFFSRKVIFELNSSFRDYESICSRKKISYIPFGVEKKNVNLKWKQTHNKVFTLIVANRLDPNRMTDVFIRAFYAQYKKDTSHLIIIGDGTDYNKLFQLVIELNICNAVTFLPPVDEVTLQEYFIKADCLLTLSASGDVGMTGKIAAGIGMPLLTYEFDSYAEFPYQACTISDLANKITWIRTLTTLDIDEIRKLIISKLSSSSSTMINSHIALYRNI